MNQGEVLDNLLHLFELEQRGEAALACRRRRRPEAEKKWKKIPRQSEKEEERVKKNQYKTPTVQAHIVEGEDGRPAGGPCAMEGHVEDAVRGLNTVLLQRDVFGVKAKLRFVS